MGNGDEPSELELSTAVINRTGNSVTVVSIGSCLVALILGSGIYRAVKWNWSVGHVPPTSSLGLFKWATASKLGQGEVIVNKEGKHLGRGGGAAPQYATNGPRWPIVCLAVGHRHLLSIP